jgi:hypothetical protein
MVSIVRLSDPSKKAMCSSFIMIAEKSIIIFKGDVLPTSVRRGIHASFFLDAFVKSRHTGENRCPVLL